MNYEANQGLQHPRRRAEAHTALFGLQHTPEIEAAAHYDAATPLGHSATLNNQQTLHHYSLRASNNILSMVD